jgi:hypothetical protein
MYCLIPKAVNVVFFFFYLLRGFDIDPAGLLVMDGPTKITAIWKFNYPYLAYIVGISTGLIAIVTALWRFATSRLKIIKN